MQRIEEQGKCIEGKETWSIIQSFFNIKNARIPQRQLRCFLASILSTQCLYIDYHSSLTRDTNSEPFLCLYHACNTLKISKKFKIRILSLIHFQYKLNT